MGGLGREDRRGWEGGVREGGLGRVSRVELVKTFGYALPSPSQTVTG